MSKTSHRFLTDAKSMVIQKHVLEQYPNRNHWSSPCSSLPTFYYYIARCHDSNTDMAKRDQQCVWMNEWMNVQPQEYSQTPNVILRLEEGYFNGYLMMLVLPSEEALRLETTKPTFNLQPLQQWHQTLLWSEETHDALGLESRDGEPIVQRISFQVFVISKIEGSTLSSSMHPRLMLPLSSPSVPNTFKIWSSNACHAKCC